MPKRRKARQPRARAIGPLHRIRDSVALRLLVKDLLKAGYEGSVVQAVDETGISRATWMRWLRVDPPGPAKGRSPRQSLRHELADQLEGLVAEHFGEKGRARLLQATTPPGAHEAMMAYRRWAKWRRDHFFRGRHADWLESVRGLDERVEAEVPEYAKFVEEMQRTFVDGCRLQVAKLRILEPYLEAAASGGLELGYEELPVPDRIANVRLAVRGERWLLQQRGPEADRAEEVALKAQGVTSRP